MDRNQKSYIIIAAFFVLAVGFYFYRSKPVKIVPKPIAEVPITPQPVPTPKPLAPVKVNTIKKAQQVHVPVLMYHHVGVPLDQAGIDLTVSPSDFEAQVKYFQSEGYHTVTLRQVYESIENGAALPSKPIVFTFDDGYKDVFTNAVPILEKYGYTGTFAIATELLGRPTYAVWDDVINAQKANMEIVSHTENHLDLVSPKYSDEDLKREIFGSKQILEEKLGTTMDFFVYPYGHYNQKVLDLVKQAGYKMAFTTAYGQDETQADLLNEPRVRVHGQNGLEKLKKIFEPEQRIASSRTSP